MVGGENADITCPLRSCDAVFYHIPNLCQEEHWGDRDWQTGRSTCFRDHATSGWGERFGPRDIVPGLWRAYLRCGASDFLHFFLGNERWCGPRGIVPGLWKWAAGVWCNVLETLYLQHFLQIGSSFYAGSQRGGLQKLAIFLEFFAVCTCVFAELPYFIRVIAWKRHV